MTEQPAAVVAVPLERARSVAQLFEATFAILGRGLPAFAAISLVVVVPVGLVVMGLGLGQLGAGYDASPPLAALGVEAGVGFLVTTPLVTAMCVHAVLEIGAGRRPAAGKAIQAGLDVFAPVLLAVTIYAIAVFLGLIVLVIPGIYIAVRGYFVSQEAVIEGHRGAEALRASWVLTEGRWWRILGIAILFNVAAAAPAALLTLPFELAADAADAQALALAGSILTQFVVAPILAIAGTLLYFDLRARAQGGTPVTRGGDGTVVTPTDGPPADDLEAPERPVRPQG